MNNRIIRGLILTSLLGCGTKSPELIIRPASTIVKYSSETSDHDVVLTLQNLGDEPLEVLSVRTSCSCTVADLPTNREIAGHSETALKLKVSPAMFGESESTITIVTNSKQRPTQDYRIRMVGADLPVPHILSQTPSIEVLGHTAGEELSGALEIRTVEDSASVEWIAGVETNSDQVTAKLRPPVEKGDLGGGVVGKWYVFDITAKCPESELLSTQLELQFNGQESKAGFRSQLTATRLQRVKCIPSEILLESEKFPGHFDVLILSEENETFAISGVDLVCGENRIPLLTGQQPESAAHKLRLAVPDTIPFSSTDSYRLEIRASILTSPLPIPVVAIKNQ